jgi:hypothetical protein
MGLEKYTARFLLEAKASGVSFGRTLTLGRQNFFVARPDLEKLAGDFRFSSAEFLNSFPAAELVFVEPFFKKILGASVIESMDASNYEAATHVHDMNTPLPSALRNKYDVVFEAGSLEHIFNFPIAIQNLMLAVRPGGYFFIQTPANNYFGHGLYQFSPELFYRVLSPANGFQIKRMQVFEHFFPGHFFAASRYAVTDPEKVRKRVQLVNNRPTLLLIEACKTADVPIFATPPQQSDYVQLWGQTGASPAAAEPTCFQNNLVQKLYSIPLKWVGSLLLQYFGNRKQKPALSNKEFFRKES